ncbi:GxxExxY protein [Algoriphagus zhangzhouensis]|uniref:GxxExxY protein n=1 Tax=Algoriphagus zhangzhouensis TaxID=1073327 RepID=A0A1M7ZBQ0_9BACT|nr:GxxExxY protein [Algoriphagus zhangzhouensis]TDY46769.1 GxxExxY protein [Algoriphagus zhangzhouensis]SHO62272.1 GxxExxY protein [Algoriphagus zhangzhouensis]
MTENEISSKIIGAAIEVHKQLGPGLLESTYETCLTHELTEEGLNVRRQVLLPIEYKSLRLDAGYRIDLIVEEKVIIELKVVDEFNSIHIAQLLTYLKLSKNKLGILLNFNVSRLKDGVRRVVNNL